MYLSVNMMNKPFWLQQTTKQHLDSTCTKFGAAEVKRATITQVL